MLLSDHTPAVDTHRSDHHLHHPEMPPLIPSKSRQVRTTASSVPSPSASAVVSQRKIIGAGYFYQYATAKHNKNSTGVILVSQIYF